VAPFDLEAWLVANPSSASVVQAGASVLRRRALDVGRSLLSMPAFARLIEVMIETMRAAPGVGLAAPQIGVPLRVFVAEDTEERMAHQSREARAIRGRVPLPLTVLINPSVVPTSGNEATFYEGCLSVRGYGALVRRAAAVHVTGLGENGRPVSLDVDGWPARIMQHEMDHLDGTLYVDRMIPRSLAGEGELARLSSLPLNDVLAELVSPRDEP
jgi:peptide deformylase